MNETQIETRGETKTDKDGTPYEQNLYFGIAIDPIHIGTGGYRLGRVDNTIARDPTTNLPILFGSSIEGTARTYSAYRLIEDDESIKKQQNKDVKKYLDCAGKTVEEEKKKRTQCGECEICITYGFSNKKRSLHGMTQFSDAKILFFPVHTMVGPVWVTCPMMLSDFKENEKGLSDRLIGLKDKLSENRGEKIKEMALVCKELRKSLRGGKINLGWLYLEIVDDTVDPGNWKYVNEKTTETEPLKKLGDLKEIKEVLQRLVIVSDALFPHIVNSNLEVRTSVSIDPTTGAAEEGALFTYEAIPRGTVMYFTVTFLNPKNFEILKEKEEDKNKELEILKKIKTVKETVKKGFELFEYLGLGGMGTRGFGRFKILNSRGEGNG